MALFGIVFLTVALVLLGVGLAIGIFVMVAAVGLLSLGILSSSVLVGLKTGRPRTAIRAFLILSGVAVGSLGGVICAWALAFLFEAYSGGGLVFAYGALAGAVVGAALSLLFELFARRVYTWAAFHFTSSRTHS